MRIAVWHNFPSGGGKRALFDHVRGLLERGHYVEAWSPPSIDRAYLPLETMIKQHIVPMGDVSYRITDKLQITLQINRMARAMEEHSRQCAEEISQGGFDILFANSCMFFASAPIGRYVKIPSLLYLQEPKRGFYEAHPDPFWAARSRDGPLFSVASLLSTFLDLRRIRNGRVQVREEVRNAKSYGVILCNSYFSRESILRAYGLAANVCYLGVDPKKFKPGLAEREPFAVALGRFSRPKNARLCIEALACMKAPRPDLVWIADNVDDPFLSDMRVLAAEKGVNLLLKIKIGDDELVNLLQRATAMIYAPRLEPFGLAPLEANACGTPVVATAEGGVRETIIDGVNGLVADADPPALSASLERLFGDPALARRLGEEGRRLVETKWSYDAATGRIIAELESEICRAGRSPSVEIRAGVD